MQKSEYVHIFETDCETYPRNANAFAVGTSDVQLHVIGAGVL